MPANTEATNEGARSRRSKKSQTGQRREGKSLDTSALKDFLGSLGLDYTPTVHVNGRIFVQALLTVDFGAPLKPVKLSSEQVQELNDHMRAVARDIIGRDGNIRISHDSANGNVYWASVLA